MSLESLVWLGYAAAAIFVVAICWRAINKLEEAPARPKTLLPEVVVRTESKRPGLQSDVLKEGTGSGAKNGDTLIVQYRAFLTTGQEVDSSYDRPAPLKFKLGAGKMISGWEIALVGAKEGEKRRVTVPSKLAYGDKGSPSGRVPPGADVIFEIELIEVKGA